MPAAIEYVKEGRLRALAVTSTKRSVLLSDLPTVDNFLPSYESSTLAGLGAPKNAPAEIVERLNKEVNTVLAHPKFKARLAELGGVALPGSPADFGKLMGEETEKWAKVVRFSGAKPD